MKRLAGVPLAVALALLACTPALGARMYSGKLEIRHADDFRHDVGRTNYSLKMGRGHGLPLRPTAVPTAASGTKVTVRGTRVGRWLEGAVRAKGGLVHKASAPGPHRVAVLLLNFSSDQRQPFTKAAVEQAFFGPSNSTAAFYSEQSYGDVTLSGTVYDWRTISANPSTCTDNDVDTWAAQASAGLDLTGYDNIVYVFPQLESCGWAGLGEMPGNESWLNGDISVRVAAHELGHNMGLHHASSYRCTSGGVQVIISSNCTTDEYGDPFDVMGQNARHSNGWHLLQLGYLTGSNVQTATTTGTYTIHSAATRGSGTELLRVPTTRSKNGKPLYYDVDLRTPTGLFDNFASTDPVVNGLTIHMDPNASVVTQSLLLDANPNAGSFTNSSLTPGRTFTDGDISITAGAVTGDTATVTVTFGAPPPDTEPPSAPTPLSATAALDHVDLGWQASGDNVGVAGYRVFRDGALVATTTATGWSDRAVAPGSAYLYQVSAYDAAGNATQSNALSVVVPTVAPPPPPEPGTEDFVAPKVRILTPGPRAKLRRKARISATASDDKRVTRVVLSIDGRPWATAAGPRVARTWSLLRVRPGLHAIEVRAIDAMGNSGSRMVTVRVLRERR